MLQLLLNKNQTISPFLLTSHIGDILPPTSTDREWFGYDAKISGDGSTMIISAPQGNGFKGCVYVYVLQNGEYVYESIITASNGAVGDRFGWSVDISHDGTTLLVGAPYKNTSIGSCYVFTRPSGGSWTQKVVTSTSSYLTSDYFGYSVSMNASGTVFLIMLPGRNRGFLYSYNGGNSITYSSNIGDNYQGYRNGVIAADGKTAAIAAVGSGVVMILKEVNGTWVPESLVGSGNTDFGNSMSFSSDGNRLLIGDSEYEKVIYNQSYGAGYIYKRTSGIWGLEKILQPSRKILRKYVGFKVSLSPDGTKAVLGRRNIHLGESTKLAILFAFDGSSWSEQFEIDIPELALSSYDSYTEPKDHTTVVISPDSTKIFVGYYGEKVGNILKAGKIHEYSISAKVVN